MEIGPNPDGLGSWLFIKGSSEASDENGGMLGYKYTSYPDSVYVYGNKMLSVYTYVKQQPREYRSYELSTMGMNGKTFYMTGHFGISGSIGDKYYSSGYRTVKIEEPPYLNERFV